MAKATKTTRATKAKKVAKMAKIMAAKTMMARAVAVTTILR